MSMSKRKSVGLVALLALLALGGAQVNSHAGPNDDPKIPYEKYTLANGLEVILVVDNKTPIVMVDVWYHVGSGDETPGRSGFAHLFEHMMFQGTANTGEDQHFKILAKIGASNVNGSTNFVRTNYFEQVPSNQLETALWLESERMGYLLDTVTEKSLKNQIDVVRNERRQRIDSSPYAVERFALLAALYPEGHPYRYEVIGKHEDLEAASVDDVKNFFRKWYVPSNATLTIAGDIDVPATKAAVEKWFGGFPKAEKPQHKQVDPPAITKTVRLKVEDPFAKLRRVHYAWHSPPLLAPGDAELDILASALGAPGTGRLYKALVVDRQLARNVAAFQQSGRMSSIFHVFVDLMPDADLAEVEKIIDAELARVMAEAISDRELKRAVTNFESQVIWGLESLMARAETLQQCNDLIGNPDCLTLDLDRYRTSSPAKVLDTAKKVLPKQARVEVITMPKGGK